MPARIQNRATLLAGLSGEDRRRRALALDLADEALAAADPQPATASILRRWKDEGWPPGPVQVLAVGKAAGAMTAAAQQTLEVLGGFALGREAEGLVSLPADHPLPHPCAPEAATTLRRGLHGPALVLLSGGGSSMLCDPAEGLDIDDLRHSHDVLLRSGLPIDAMNAIRAALDRLKGGGLAQLLAAGSRAVLLSDVPGHGPDVVASGPLSPARALPPQLPPGLRSRVLEHLQRWTPPSPPPLIPVAVAADNATVRRALADAARAKGLTVQEVEEPLRGEAREAGEAFSQGPIARVAGGETPVRVLGDGVGGRNQEFALGAFEGGGLVLSLATDGIDGPSGSAGAVVDDALRRRARDLGLHPAEWLARSDADPFLRALNGRLETGPTGTNVADLALYLP